MKLLAIYSIVSDWCVICMDNDIQSRKQGQGGIDPPLSFKKKTSYNRDKKKFKDWFGILCQIN